MIGYCAYLIGSDGRIKERVDLLCDDDETAKAKAELLVDGHDVELWQLDRPVCSFKAKE